MAANRSSISSILPPVFNKDTPFAMVADWLIREYLLNLRGKKKIKYTPHRAVLSVCLIPLFLSLLETYCPAAHAEAKALPKEDFLLLKYFMLCRNTNKKVDKENGAAFMRDMEALGFEKEKIELFLTRVSDSSHLLSRIVSDLNKWVNLPKAYKRLWLDKLAKDSLHYSSLLTILAHVKNHCSSLIQWLNTEKIRRVCESSENIFKKIEVAIHTYKIWSSIFPEVLKEDLLHTTLLEEKHSLSPLELYDPNNNVRSTEIAYELIRPYFACEFGTEKKERKDEKEEKEDALEASREPIIVRNMLGSSAHEIMRINRNNRVLAENKLDTTEKIRTVFLKGEEVKGFKFRPSTLIIPRHPISLVESTMHCNDREFAPGLIINLHTALSIFSYHTDAMSCDKVKSRDYSGHVTLDELIHTVERKEHSRCGTMIDYWNTYGNKQQGPNEILLNFGYSDIIGLKLSPWSNSSAARDLIRLRMACVRHAKQHPPFYVFDELRGTFHRLSDEIVLRMAKFIPGEAKLPDRSYSKILAVAGIRPVENIPQSLKNRIMDNVFHSISCSAEIYPPSVTNPLSYTFSMPFDSKRYRFSFKYSIFTLQIGDKAYAVHSENGLEDISPPLVATYSRNKAEQCEKLLGRIQGHIERKFNAKVSLNLNFSAKKIEVKVIKNSGSGLTREEAKGILKFIGYPEDHQPYQITGKNKNCIVLPSTQSALLIHQKLLLECKSIIKPGLSMLNEKTSLNSENFSQLVTNAFEEGNFEFSKGLLRSLSYSFPGYLLILNTHQISLIIFQCLRHNQFELALETLSYKIANVINYHDPFTGSSTLDELIHIISDLRKRKNASFRKVAIQLDSLIIQSEHPLLVSFLFHVSPNSIILFDNMPRCIFKISYLLDAKIAEEMLRTMLRHKIIPILDYGERPYNFTTRGILIAFKRAISHHLRNLFIFLCLFYPEKISHFQDTLTHNAVFLKLAFENMLLEAAKEMARKIKETGTPEAKALNEKPWFKLYSGRPGHSPLTKEEGEVDNLYNPYYGSFFQSKRRELEFNARESQETRQFVYPERKVTENKLECKNIPSYSL
jgi:hypothetical protein